MIFLDSTYKWDIFVFLCPIYFTEYDNLLFYFIYQRSHLLQRVERVRGEGPALGGGGPAETTCLSRTSGGGGRPHAPLWGFKKSLCRGLFKDNGKMFILWKLVLWKSIQNIICSTVQIYFKIQNRKTYIYVLNVNSEYPKSSTIIICHFCDNNNKIFFVFKDNNIRSKEALPVAIQLHCPLKCNWSKMWFGSESEKCDAQ